LSPTQRESASGATKEARIERVARKPIVLNAVDFDPPAPPVMRKSVDASIGSFNESIDFATYPKAEHFDPRAFLPDALESLANKVFDTECMEDSNFSNILGQADMEESDLACCKEGGGKPYNEEGLHSFFKEKIQSQNPGLFNTIESILEEEKGEGEASKAAAARSSESGDSRHKKPAYMDSNHSVSASSLNLSEPSLLETSTDNSPMPYIGSTKAAGETDEQKKTSISSPSKLPTKAIGPPKKATSFQYMPQSKPVEPPRRRSISTERVQWQQNRSGGLKRVDSLQSLSQKGACVMWYIILLMLDAVFAVFCYDLLTPYHTHN
jgi:hypothetical protein